MSNLALALAVAVCVSGYGDGMSCGCRSWRGLLVPVVPVLGVPVPALRVCSERCMCTWNGIAVMPCVPKWSIILGKTAALDALAATPHGASGRCEHVKYLNTSP